MGIDFPPEARGELSTVIQVEAAPALAAVPRWPRTCLNWLSPTRVPAGRLAPARSHDTRCAVMQRQTETSHSWFLHKSENAHKPL